MEGEKTPIVASSEIVSHWVFSFLVLTLYLLLFSEVFNGWTTNVAEFTPV